MNSTVRRWPLPICVRGCGQFRTAILAHLRFKRIVCCWFCNRRMRLKTRVYGRRKVRCYEWRVFITIDSVLALLTSLILDLMDSNTVLTWRSCSKYHFLHNQFLIELGCWGQVGWSGPHDMCIIFALLLLPVSLLRVHAYCLCISIGYTSCPLTVLEAIKHCTNLVDLRWVKPRAYRQ